MELVFIICIQVSSAYALLYPASTVLQLIASLNVPITDLSPQRRVAFDWGFQMNYDMPYKLSSFYNVPIWPTTNRTSTRQIRNSEMHSRDFSLIEIYEAAEEILKSFGFDASCLLLSICDLMQFPFDKRYENFLSQVLSFFLRPSQHRSERNKKLEAYLLAEFRGKRSLKCADLYPSCTTNPLDLISNFI